MRWQLPSHDKKAIYLQLINVILQGIEQGALLPGEQLPPERQLAHDLGVNRSTVQHALNELVSQGILLRQQGSGTWVNSGKWGVLSAHVNWRNYFTTDRLSDPESFMVQLKQLRQQPEVLNLADSQTENAPLRQLALPSIAMATLLQQNTANAMSGSPALKAQIRRHLHPYLNQPLPDEQLLITAGAQQAFFLIAQGLLSYGDVIAIESPSYLYQLALFQVAGIRVFGVPRTKNGGLSLDDLQHLYYQHHLKFIFVNPTNQNPTTQTMPLAERHALIARCRQLNLHIVEDDPFGFTLALSQQSIPTLKQLDPNNVIYIGSLSEFSGADTRIGWLIAPPAIVTRLSEIRQEMESGISIFSQYLATQLLSHPNLADLVAQQQHQLAHARQRLLRLLAPFVARGQLAYQIPTLGNTLWLHILTKSTMTRADYQVFLDQQLLVLPDFLFGRHSNHVRLSYSQLPADDTLLKQRLQAVMAQLID